MSACSGDKGTSETGTGGDSTTVDPTTSAGPATDAPDSTTGPDTSAATGPGATTGPEATTGPDVTTGPGATTVPATTAEDTDVPETGIVDGLRTRVEDRCAPDDGPGLEFKIGGAPLECGADFPAGEPAITVSLWQGGPLAPGYYKLDGGRGFATFDDGDGVQMTESGTISLLNWNGGFPYGAVELDFPGGLKVNEAFEGEYCPSQPACK